MTLATAIVQMIASIIAYFVARGLDSILGKWVAYFTIAWEKVATEQALQSFRETQNQLASQMPEKWKEWDEWRQKLGNKNGNAMVD